MIAPLCSCGKEKVSAQRRKGGTHWFCPPCKSSKLRDYQNFNRGAIPVSSREARESLKRYLDAHWPDVLHQIADLTGHSYWFGAA